ncbi:MAG: hypothetical protein AAFV33_12050 [Chloroflexota bacterium]
MPLINPLLPYYDFMDRITGAFHEHRLTVPLLEDLTRTLLGSMGGVWGVAVMGADGHVLASAVDARVPFRTTIFEEPLLYELFATGQALYEATRAGDFEMVGMRLYQSDDAFMDYYYVQFAVIPGTPYATFLVRDR